MVSQATDIIHDHTNPGLWFDTLAIPVFDAMSGVSAGKGAAKLANKIDKRFAYNRNKAAIVKRVGKSAYKDISQTADIARKHMKKGDVKPNVPQVVTQAKDLKTNKSYTGVNRQLRQNLRKTERGMSRSQAKKNSMFKGTSKSNVQKRVPNAKNVLGRDPRSCAEHSALHKLYNDRPSAKPNEIRTNTVQVNPKKGTINALKRCNNCQQFDSAMGSVPTDKIHGMCILENPGCPVSKGGAALVVGSAACSAVKQRSKASQGVKKTAESKETSSKSKPSRKKSNEEKEMHQVSSTKIRYTRSQKLHKKTGRCRRSKVKQHSLGEGAKSQIIAVDDEDNETDTCSDGEEQTASECTMLVKKLR